MGATREAAAQPIATGPSSKLKAIHLYVGLWLLVTLILTFEYARLNGLIDSPGVFSYLQDHGVLLPGPELDPSPGRPLSFTLGWVGFAFICLTNLYILKKRLPAWREIGRLQPWLDFHIFCGLLGPTLIVFHSNFQVRGLVAISFWSMIISFASGVIGRYLYMQLLRERADLKRELATYESGFKRFAKIVGSPLPLRTLEQLKWNAFVFAGGSVALQQGKASLATVLLNSLAGESYTPGQARSLAAVSTPKGCRLSTVVKSCRLPHFQPSRAAAGFGYSA